MRWGVEISTLCTPESRDGREFVHVRMARVRNADRY